MNLSIFLWHMFLLADTSQFYSFFPKIIRTPYFRFTEKQQKVEETQMNAPLWEARMEFRQAGVCVASACKLGRVLA